MHSPFQSLFIGAIFLLLLQSCASNKELTHLPKPVKKNYSFIPSGTVNFQGETQQVNAFFLSKYEVSNLQYREFIYDLKQQGNAEKLATCAVDTNNWNKENPNAFFAPMAEHYHSHPAYNNYPVVNITLDAAKAYCNWLTKKLNVNASDQDVQYLVRLPQHAEWLRAANADNNKATYAWGGNNLQNNKGDYLCNFNNYGAEHITYNSEADAYEVVTSKQNQTKDNALLTASVGTYFPSEFGLYNLNGNVAEMVTENKACGGSWLSPGYDVRNASYFNFSGVSNQVGFRPILVITRK